MIDVMKITDPCKTLALTSGGGSANVKVDEGVSNYVSIYNPAATVTFVTAGGASVEAAATDTWIPPGQTISYKKDPKQNYIAGFNDQEDVTLYIQVGGGV